MANLKYYDKERKMFETEFEDIFIKQEDTELLCKKLARHFKFIFNGITFRKIKYYGWAHCKKNTLTLKREHNDLLTICHELAHLWQFQKDKKGYHNAKMLNKVKRLIKYCHKNKNIVNLWVCG